MRRDRRGLAFGLGAGTGLLGGLVGLGGAEFRLPVLVGVLGFTPRQAVPINLAASLVVLAAAFPVRLASVPAAEMLPHTPAILGMLAGSTAAAWIGAGLVRRLPDRLLGRAILVLLVALGLMLIVEGLAVAEPTRRVGTGIVATVVVAAACGVVIGLVSSLLGVAGGELIIPAFILLYGADAKLAGSMSILVGMPTIAVGLARWLALGSILRDRAALRGALAPLALGAAGGAVLGGALLGLVPAAALKVGLGLILIWSAGRIFAHLPAPALAHGLAARVARQDLANGLTVYDTAGGPIVGPATDACAGAIRRLTVAPDAVVLAAAPPGAGAMGNAVAASVVAIAEDAEAGAACVEIETAAGRLSARLARNTVAELGLAPGVAVWAVIEAAAIRAR